MHAPFAEHAVVAQVDLVQHEAPGYEDAIHHRQGILDAHHVFEHRPRDDEVEALGSQQSLGLFDRYALLYPYARCVLGQRTVGRDHVSDALALNRAQTGYERGIETALLDLVAPRDEPIETRDLGRACGEEPYGDAEVVAGTDLENAGTYDVLVS